MGGINNDSGLIHFIWSSRANRLFLLIAILVTVLLWTGFKILYPCPNVIFDTYNYAQAAALNWSFNSWPIGYSKFLQLFALFSHSANLLVCLQYLFVESCCLVFFFSWLYLFRPGRIPAYILFMLLFANPLLLYLCNHIISDPLFIGLSLLWICQLFWVICKPQRWMIFTHALLLAIAFTIRYNALYYPFVAILAFMLSRQRLWFKIAGAALPVILITGFIFYTSAMVGKETGQRQFSAFGSWKLANDALYVFAHIPRDKMEPVPKKFRELDSEVREYFRHPFAPPELLFPDFTSGSFFMFSRMSPLVIYMDKHYGPGWPFLNTKKYWAVAPLYQSYGLYIVRKYPIAFCRYFLWPNFIRYYTPPREIFGSKESFELEEDYGGPYLRKLFTLTSIQTPPSSIKLSKQIVFEFPTLMGLGHFSFLFGLAAFLFCGGPRRIGKPYSYCIWLVAFLWICDLCFSVLSAGIVLRYQLFVMAPEMAFALYFIQFTYRNIDRRWSLPAKDKAISTYNS